MPRGGRFRRAGGPLWAELSIGSSAGSELYHRMSKARESVLVVSPYVGEHQVGRLLELHERGVVVELVIMEDFASAWLVNARVWHERRAVGRWRAH